MGKYPIFLYLRVELVGESEMKTKNTCHMRWIAGLLSMTMVATVWGQSSPKIPQRLLKPVPKVNIQAIGSEVWQGKRRTVPHIESRFPNQIVGFTYYDLQTNNSMMPRVAVANEVVRVVWTFSADEQPRGFPDRGTGFNRYENGSWVVSEDDLLDLKRIEPERCGWPNVGVLGDGTEVVISHSTASNVLMMCRRAPNATEWDCELLEDKTGSGKLWPRMAIGGPDNNTIHLISVTRPPRFNGRPYRNIIQHLLYQRSTDGGETWDIEDLVLPGISDSIYDVMEADAYFIAARDTIVAIVHFGGWNDIVLWKSTDNGATWKKILINEFPLHKYDPGRDGLYSADDLSYKDTLGGPGSQGGIPAIYTSDGTGSVTIDANGECHVVFGEMFVAVALDGADTNFVFYPAWGYIDYWREAFADTDDTSYVRPYRIATYVDYDGNGRIDIQSINQIAFYGGGAVNMPYIVSDDDNNLFVAYSAINEQFKHEDDDEFYRHIYLIRSDDGGETWTDPYDVINYMFYEDEDEKIDTAYTEGVYPSMTVDDNYLYLVFQKDYNPGSWVILTNLGGDDNDNDFDINDIVYLKLTKQFEAVNVERVVRPETFDMQVTPNPVQENHLTLSFDLPSASNVRVQLIDMDGHTQTLLAKQRLEAGPHRLVLPLKETPTVGFVKLWVGNATATKKVVFVR